jgi:formylglycine-generating enzyme required for sulfatase activity
MVRVPDTLTGEPLSFSVYELTWAQYAKAVDGAACPLPRSFADTAPTAMVSAVRDDYPMTSLPPVEINCYLEWVSALSGHQYRLPTEAEWQAVAEVAYSGTIELDRPEFEPGAASDPRSPVYYRLIRRVGGKYHPTVGMFDLFSNASEVVTSPREEDDWGITRGGNDFVKQFDRVRGWNRVPAKSSSATVGFRVVREG